MRSLCERKAWSKSSTQVVSLIILPLDDQHLQVRLYEAEGKPGPVEAILMSIAKDKEV